MASAFILVWSRTSLRAWRSTARAWAAIWAADDAQLEGVPCADASGVGGDGGGACVHLLAMRGVECFWMAVASGARINLLQV
jgi:hypothetical protein